MKTSSYGACSGDATGAHVAVVAIPGIPYYLVPPFLQALQATTLYYQQRFQTKQQQKAFSITDWDRLVRSTDDNPHNTAKRRRKIQNDAQGRILDRMAEAAANTSQVDNKNDDEDCQQKFVDAVNTWMDRVKHSAQKQTSSTQEDEAIATTTDPVHGGQSQENQKDEEEPKKQYNIPYSFFLYLWEVQQQHKRVAVRRAALLLSGLLLQKSKDCRAYLDHNTCLKEWVTTLMATEHTITMLMRNNKKKLNPERLRSEIVLFQREALALLDHLRQRYHTFYPKYSVAYKNLQRQCLHSFESISTIAEGLPSTSTQNRMVDFRRLRDLALQHGENEITKIETKLQQAHVCLEILIPRMGVEATTTTAIILASDNDGENQPMAQHTAIDIDDNNADDSDDDDDSAIDWEEGEPTNNLRTTDDTPTPTAAATSHHQKTQQHLSAVERTIATMHATGTREELEVDFNRGRRKRPRSNDDGGNEDDVNDDNYIDNDDDTVHEDNHEITTTTVRTKQAKAKVQRIIQKLATRHLLRLSAWLDGLRNSDGLVLLPRDTTKDTTSNTTTITKLSSASLVALSAQQQEHRRFLIQKLTGLKDEMTRLMASVASHLQIHAHHVATVAATNPSHTLVHRVTILPIVPPAVSSVSQRIIGLIHKKKQQKKGRIPHRHPHSTTPHKRKIKIVLQK